MCLPTYLRRLLVFARQAGHMICSLPPVPTVHSSFIISQHHTLTYTPLLHTHTYHTHSTRSPRTYTSPPAPPSTSSAGGRPGPSPSSCPGATTSTG